MNINPPPLPPIVSSTQIAYPVLNPLSAHLPKTAAPARAANGEGGCATHAKL